MLFIALSAGVWVAFVKKDEPSQPNPPQALPTNASTTPPLPFMGMKISSIGGAELASDGKTRIRFTPDCEGAVQAAASYTRMSDGVIDPKQAPKREETLKHVAWGETEGLNMFRERVITPLLTPTYTYPEQVGFRVNSCLPAKTASISVAWIQKAKAEPPYKFWLWGCSAETYSLAWLGNDWRMTEYKVIIDGGTPCGGTEERQTAFTSAELQRMMAQAPPGWQEFTNAPR